ncbi:MAG TPA: YetF domain-containing protein [Thermomonas sp.]|nr:YetF domain-containing protein [Thermomonas sp.]
MEELFQLSAPWWHFVLRACAIYLLVMVLVRVSGKRAVGQFTPFDLVLLILIGNAVQNGINGGDNSLTGAAIMATTLIALNYAVAFVTSRSRKVEKFVEGEPVVLARNGKLFEGVLRRQLVSRQDFRESLRMNGVEDVSEVELALLETNGSISVVKKKRDD